MFANLFFLKYKKNKNETPQLSEKKKAALNAKLYICAEDINYYDAGNLYVFDYETAPGWILNKTKLLDDMVPKPSSSDNADTKKRKQQNKDNLKKDAKIIAIEIGALCDHSQQNVPTGKFLLGFCVPKKYRNIIKLGEFLKEMGPFYLHQNQDARNTDANENDEDNQYLRQN